LFWLNILFFFLEVQFIENLQKFLCIVFAFAHEKRVITFYIILITCLFFLFFGLCLIFVFFVSGTRSRSLLLLFHALLIVGFIFAINAVFPLASCLVFEFLIEILTNSVFSPFNFLFFRCYLLNQLFLSSLLLLIIDAFGDLIEFNFSLLLRFKLQLLVSGETSTNTNLKSMKEIRLHLKPA